MSQNNQVTSILLVGVGGQGTILASKILGDVALAQGYDVKVSEIHGMAQRGGSVVTHVKWGQKVHSPLIEAGQADYIIATEQLEALRWVKYLKPGGTLITNLQQIYPVPVILGVQDYPENIIARLEAKVNTKAIDALGKALACGNGKAANVVLIGVLAQIMGLPKDLWLGALEKRVPAKFLEVNQAAFAAGFES